MKRKIYIAVFLVTCLLPVLGLLIRGPEASSENRSLAKPPSLQTEEGRFNVNVLKDAGAWYEDHFGFRNEWVTGYALLAGKLFGVSAQDGVIAGTNGWLYYRDSLGDFQGSEQLTDRQLFDIAHTMRMIQAGLREDLVDFLFAVAPNKNSLYGENMPYYVSGFREKENNYSRLLPFLEAEGVHTVNLKEILAASEAAKEKTLYHERDSHWNNLGASLAAGAILEALGVEHPDYSSRAYEVRKDFRGDLDTMLYPAAVTPEEEYYYTEAPDFTYSEEVESNFAPHIYTESKGKGWSLVMYRDSFGNALLPFMAECFHWGYFSRGVPYQITDDVYGNEADAVAIVRAERFLPDLAQNPPLMLAPLVKAAELEGAVYSTEIEDLEVEKLDFYTRVTGRLPEGMVDVDSKIIVRVDGSLNYEAFPMSDKNGREGFQLLLVTDLLEEEPDFEVAIR